MTFSNEKFFLHNSARPLKCSGNSLMIRQKHQQGKHSEKNLISCSSSMGNTYCLRAVKQMKFGYLTTENKNLNHKEKTLKSVKAFMGGNKKKFDAVFKVDEPS